MSEPNVPHSGRQQFTPIPAQGFNVYAQMFMPAQYQATVSLMSQPLMLGPMLSYSQASGPPRAPMLATMRLTGNGFAQGSVAAPMTGQQMLN